MNLAGLTACIALFLGLPVPPALPTVIYLKSAPLQKLCRNTGNRLYLACYVIETQTIVIDIARIKREEALAHELAHHIIVSAGAGGRIPHSEVYWVAQKAETWCREWN